MNREEINLNKFGSVNTLWSIMDTAIDGIVLIDERGTVQLVNAAIEKMFGYTLKELYGKNISILMHTPHKENHDSYLHNYLTTGQAKIIGIGREITAKKKDGEIFPLRLAVSEVYIEEQRYFTGILHNLTDQRLAEEQLFKLTQELEQKVQQRTEELGEVVNKLLKLNKQFTQEIKERIEIEEELKVKEMELKILLDKEIELNQMKSRFVSMASHEFRTPLSTILSSAALIGKYEDAEGQERREKHISKIRNAVNNLTNILNDFLSLEKLEEGSLAPRPEWLDLTNFCQDLVEEMNLQLKQGQKIQLDILPDVKLLKTDPRFLYNSIINILSNAIKYSPEDSTILLNVNKDNNEIIFSIQDQGIGIPHKEQVHLFNRFFRATNAINIQGTGLGLHIVKRYVQLLKGRISFESTPESGTRFDIFVSDIEND